MRLGFLLQAPAWVCGGSHEEANKSSAVDSGQLKAIKIYRRRKVSEKTMRGEITG